MIGIVVIALVLSGCTRTVYVDRPIEVRVRVPAPCLKAGDIPAPVIYPVGQLRQGVTDGELIGALYADRAQRDLMERVLRALLQGCVAAS